jgi:hypothetical protein
VSKVHKISNVDKLIVKLRKQDVILDNDIAKLYGVETKRINEAVLRNSNKFPKGYVIDLKKKEWDSLKEQIATSKNFLANAEITSKGGKVKIPRAFTEKGLYMLATILKSKEAEKATIQIIETFAKIRELRKNVSALANTESPEIKQNLIEKSGEIMSKILNKELKDKESETTIEINLAVIKVKHKFTKTKA